jgi:hypothetical protein
MLNQIIISSSELTACPQSQLDVVTGNVSDPNPNQALQGDTVMNR